MANVNLVESNDISITQTDDDITLGIKDTSLNAKIINKNEYSTSQEIVVGKWIDGKPLYRKVIVFPNGTGQTALKTYTLTDLGITNVDEIFIVHPSFYTLTVAGELMHYQFQYNDGSAFECNIGKTKLNLTLGYLPIAQSKIVITLEYTKTS